MEGRNTYCNFANQTVLFKARTHQADNWRLGTLEMVEKVHSPSLLDVFDALLTFKLASGLLAKEITLIGCSSLANECAKRAIEVTKNSPLQLIRHVLHKSIYMQNRTQQSSKR